VPERLPSYVEAFRAALANDSRLFAFEVEAASRGSGVVLEGWVHFPETRAALGKFLEELGFAPVDNRLATLPDPALGDAQFGLVVTSHALCYDRAQGTRSVATDCVVGEPLYLLREAAGQFLVHTSDGYLGYVAADAVRRLPEDAWLAYVGRCELSVTRDVRLPGGITLPVGARLPGAKSAAGGWQVELPNGEPAEIPGDAARRMPFPQATVDLALAAGRELLGTSYVWGGKTSAGVDCSGLVQVAYGAAGLNLPRDSNQQVLVGRLTATRWSLGGLRAGDTLYFLGEHGRIRHTALYLGDNRYLQAEMPAVEISSLDPADPDFDAKRRASFAFAKRPLD
jgi:hypothetical protein